MTTEEVAALFHNAVMSGYVLPGLILALCVFGGAVLALGLRRKRATAIITGVFFAISGLYLGERYTALPLLIFGLAMFSGLLVSSKLTERRRSPAKLRRTTRVQQFK